MSLLTYPKKILRFILFSFRYLKAQYKNRGLIYEINHPEKVSLHATAYIGKDALINACGEKDKIEIQAHTQIYRRVELSTWFNNRLTIKSYSSINDGCKILGDVTIEKYNLFSCNICISSGNHYADHLPEMLIKDQDALVLNDPVLQKNHSNPVHIEEDCWVGWGAFVKAGVHIGRGAIIGAYSVIVNDVDPYAVMAGIPARQLRTRVSFNPPAEITASDYRCFPYFYRGFCQNAEERQVGGTDKLAMEKKAYAVMRKAVAYEIVLLNNNNFPVTVRITSPQACATLETALSSGETVLRYEAGSKEKALSDDYDGMEMSFFDKNDYMVLRIETHYESPSPTTLPFLFIKKVKAL